MNASLPCDIIFELTIYFVFMSSSLLTPFSYRDQNVLDPTLEYVKVRYLFLPSKYCILYISNIARAFPAIYSQVVLLCIFCCKKNSYICQTIFCMLQWSICGHCALGVGCIFILGCLFSYIVSTYDLAFVNRLKESIFLSHGFLRK